MPKLKIRALNVFYNDLQALKSNVFEKLPEIKGLFVEIAKVPKFKAEVVTQGTEAHRLYAVTVSQIKKGVLKFSATKIY